MALTRITKGVIKPNENYDTHNINSTGIVTAIGLDVNGNGDISGNLSVGGVLTYEDVTSIDSVGIITAQKDIHVGGGVSAIGVGTFSGLDISGDIDVDGHTNLDNVSIAGVTTMSGNLRIQNVYPIIELIDTNNNDDFEIRNADGIFIVRDATNSVDRLSINSSGGASITGSLFVSNGIDNNGDLDVDGHTNLDNVSIAGVVTATEYKGGGSTGIKVTSAGKVLIGTSTQGSTSADELTIENTGPMGISLRTNTTGESNVYFTDGTSGTDRYTGYITYQHQYDRFRFGVNGGQLAVQINLDKSLNLYAGLSVSGIVTATGADINGDLDVDGHTNLDNVSIAGIVTALNFVKTDGTTVGGAMTGYNNDPGENNVTTLIAGRGAGNNIQLQNGDGQSAFGNVLIGDGAGKFAQNGYDYNVAVGSYAHNKLRDGSYNIAIGYRANPNVSTQVSSNTIAIGYETLDNFVGGGTAVTNGRNTVVGHAAAGTLVSGGNNLVLGMSADVSSANISNEITLGNTSINHLRVPGIGVSFSAGGAVISGIVTATSFVGSGANLTGIDATKIITGNTQVQTIDTGSDGHIKFTTEGDERLRIDSSGRFLFGTDTPSGNANRTFTIANSGSAIMELRSGTSNSSQITFSNGTSGNATYPSYVAYDHSQDRLEIGVKNNSRFYIKGDTAQSYTMLNTNIEGATSANQLTIAANPQANSCGLTIRSGTSNDGNIFFSDATSGTDEYAGYIQYEHSNDALKFGTASTERLRINSNGKAIFSEEIETPQDYPNQRPSLDLNFAATKKLDSRITYTRSGRASFINEHGLLEIVNANVPRFDHDPVTRECKGLLIEEARTNKLTYSNAPGMSSPNLGGNPQTNDSVNNITLPTGEKGTVRRYLANASGGGGRWGGYSASSSNITMTGSAWIRTVSGTGTAIIDMNDGGGKTVSLTTEWQRVTTTYTANNTYEFFDIYFSSPVTIYYWGVQIEHGAFMTSYIPTNNATATRGGDRTYIPINDGLDFYNPVESTILVDYTHQDGVTSSNLGASARLYRFRATSGADTRVDYVSNTGYNPYIASDGSSPASLSHGQSTVFGGGLNRNAVRVKENSFAVSFNGSTVVEDTSGNWDPDNAIDHVTLGGNSDNYSSQLSGHIQRFTYYPVGLPNSQLVTLTS